LTFVYFQSQYLLCCDYVVLIYHIFDLFKTKQKL